MACSHNIDDPFLVQVCRSFIKEHQRCIIAVAQSLRVSFVAHTERSNAIFQVIFQLHLSPAPCLVTVFQRFHEFRRGIRQNVSDMVFVLEYGCRRTRSSIEFEYSCQAEVVQSCQGDCIEYFLLVHGD